MVLLDLLLFLLPYPLLYGLVRVGLRSAGIAVSDPFKQTLRTTLVLYAATILVAGLADFSPLTVLSGPLMGALVVIVGWDALKNHRHHRAARNLLLATVGLVIVVALLPSGITFTTNTALAVWIANAVGWSGLAFLWLTRTPISDRNKGRMVASAVQVLGVTLVAFGFLWLT
jgi:hypothetical protein